MYIYIYVYIITSVYMCYHDWLWLRSPTFARRCFEFQRPKREETRAFSRSLDGSSTGQAPIQTVTVWVFFCGRNLHQICQAESLASVRPFEWSVLWQTEFLQLRIAQNPINSINPINPPVSGSARFFFFFNAAGWAGAAVYHHGTGTGGPGSQLWERGKIIEILAKHRASQVWVMQQ